MSQATQVSSVSHESIGAREMQARLYREIGISAVAAALHSINKPEPGKAAAVSDAPRRADGRAIHRAA